jgi:hypothetical protein
LDAAAHADVAARRRARTNPNAGVAASGLDVNGRSRGLHLDVATRGLDVDTAARLLHVDGSARLLHVDGSARLLHVDRSAALDVDPGMTGRPGSLHVDPTATAAFPSRLDV